MSRKKINKVYVGAFRNNINYLIDKHGGPVAFSSKIDVSYQAVLNWSKGENLPDGGALLKMHEKYGVSIDWLLTGQSANGSACPHCGDWPDDIRDLCAAVKKILESNDAVVRTALRSNIAAFRESIEKNRRQQKGTKNKVKPDERARDKPMGRPAGTDRVARSAAGNGGTSTTSRSFLGRRGVMKKT